MLRTLIAQGFKRFGRIADDGSYYLKKVTCSNGTWNASKGARSQGLKYGGALTNHTTVDKPAGTIITDFVQMNPNGSVNHYFRRSALNAPQGSSVDVYRGNAGDVYLRHVGHWWGMVKV